MKLPKFKIVDAEMPWGIDGRIELMGKNEGECERLDPPKWMQTIMRDCYQVGRESLKNELQELLGIRI